MDDITIKIIEDLKLNDAILIEGLPGIGLVGKIAADHLLDELKGRKFAELYSVYLPPQVVIRKNGTVKLVNNEFYYVRQQSKDGRDIVILTGEFQGITPESQYRISDAILDIAKKINITTIYTLGGLGTGNITHEPGVFGAATSKEMIKKLKEHDVIIKSDGGIFGASGLILGLGKMQGIECACLMGETHGQIIDAKSAEALLIVLTKILGIKIDMTKLEEKAKMTEKDISAIDEMINVQKKEIEREMQLSKEIPSYIR
ncbi:MAG: proteasome assembly chaperone family protein [Candidatus Altiarchaeales archaeon HGW-Altiarchaeales-3]|nr:MAG: proteasome assembly chaperone family protein [Candidatus Altiarchaeales archaeon HGW-Altiarchaeales-3]